MIDFTNCKKLKKGYGGANGNKLSVVYNDEIYMLKFPAGALKNDNLSYSNSVISEYLGSHIFKLLDIPVQETLLGTYTVDGKTKIVVACKDFTTPGVVLQDFASQKNGILSSSQNGYGMELDDILYSISELPEEIAEEAKKRFWDMFIIDAFIGNWDRHNGNWGLLYNTFNDSLSLAPVYDCGSSLYPQADESIMKQCLENVAQRHTRVFNIPFSSIRINGKHINYFDFIYNNTNKECSEALKRIIKKINKDRINDLIDSTPFISDLQKEFYKVMLNERYSLILLNSYKHIYQAASKRSR